PRAVAANVDPKRLLTKLVAAEAIDADVRKRMENYACGSGTFRMNVALSELPDFSCLPGKEAAEHHRSGVVIGPSVEYLDRSFLDARIYCWSKEPVVEILVPTTMDDSLAPAGKHVASLFCQQFSPTLPDGRSWDDAREAAAETIIATVTKFAPNFRASIIAKQIHSPLDLERKFGLTGGDIMHGRLSLDQMFSMRPQAGYADYRMPVKGLYLCGSGAHPGGGVTGAPGHNAARAIISDFRASRIPR
ncbi:MAG: NAD(P)/FAD-dependent oxidoreductase, partial [Parvularculaceae bacterium]